MNENNRMFDDLMSLTASALKQLRTARHEFRSQTKQHLGRVASDLDLVSREEFERLVTLLTKTRTSQETILERIEAIETKLKLSRRSQRVNRTNGRLPSVKKGNQNRKKSSP